jgi:phosphate transport system permease protein
VTTAVAPVRPAALGRGASRTRAQIAIDTLFAVALFLFTMIGVICLGLLLFTVYDKGWDRLAADPLAFVSEFVSRRAHRAGVKAGLVGSLELMGLVALFSFPVGVGAAIYLEEFAPKNRLTDFVEANIANLAGVPSVVYGILGLGVFVNFAGMGPSLLAGGLTLAVMSLPVIVIAGREAIRAVPPSVRLGSFALGATRWQTVRHQVLPAAMPGTLTGTILALSRAIGETAPLLVVGAAVSIFSTPRSLDDHFSALPVIIYTWTGRPQAAFSEAAAAAIIVLLAVLIAMNAVAIFLRNRFSVRW